LTHLGFVWDQKEQDFERGLDELDAYVAANDDDDGTPAEPDSSADDWARLGSALVE
jgi:hypothetical protein